MTIGFLFDLAIFRINENQDKKENVKNASQIDYDSF